MTKKFDKENKEREYFLSLVKSRFSLMEKDRKGRVYSVSIKSLLQEVFGVEKMSHEMAKNIYLLLRGEEPQDISKKFKINPNSLRSVLRRFYTKELDVESINDMICRILLWVLQKKNILLIPSEEEIKKGLTLKEIDETII